MESTEYGNRQRRRSTNLLANLAGSSTLLDSEPIHTLKKSARCRTLQKFLPTPPTAHRSVSRSRMMCQLEDALPDLLPMMSAANFAGAPHRRASTAANGSSRSASVSWQPPRQRFNSVMCAMTDGEFSDIPGRHAKVSRKDSCGSSGSSSSTSDSVALSDCTQEHVKCCISSEDTQDKEGDPSMTSVELSIEKAADNTIISCSSVFDSPTEEREFFAVETTENCLFCEKPTCSNVEISQASPVHIFTSSTLPPFTEQTAENTFNLTRNPDFEGCLTTFVASRKSICIQKKIHGFSEALAENLIGLQKDKNSADFATVDVLPHKGNYSISLGIGTCVSLRIQAKKPKKSEQQTADIQEEKKPSTSSNVKEIKVTCNYWPASSKEEKMFCQLPRFVLYDYPDQEAGQVIRMIFAYANIPYETFDVEEEQAINDFPLRSVPVLEIDGVKIGNNTSICRHLGWRYELSGQTALEDSIVDMIAETVQETRTKLKDWFDHIEYKNVDYSKPECSDDYAWNLLDGYLSPIIEKVLRKSQSPWLVGHKLTWADLMVASFFNPIIYHRPEFFDNYPNIYLHNKKIAELPRLEGMMYCVRDRVFS